MPIAPDWRALKQRRRQWFLSFALLLAAVAILASLERRQPASGVTPPPTAEAPAVPTVEPVAQPMATGPGFRLLTLRGTPAETGRLYGTLLGDSIRKVVGEFLYGQLVAGAGLSRERVTALAERWTRLLPQTLLDQMQGMAETSGVPLTDLVALQAFPELGAWGESCGYGALTPATRSRELLLGYNLDLDAPALRDELLVLALDEEGAPPVMGVAFAGLVTPLVGVNQQGLAAALLDSEEAPLAGPEGLPLLVLLRRVLQESAGLDEARRMLEQADRTVAANLLLAQATPVLEAGVAEVAPAKLGWRAPEAGRLAVTNHARTLRAQPVADAEPGLCARFDRLQAWLADHAGTISRASQPLRAAECYGEQSLLSATLEPGTHSVGVAVGQPAAAQEPVWLHWAPESGTLGPTDTTGHP